MRQSKFTDRQIEERTSQEGQVLQSNMLRRVAGRLLRHATPSRSHLFRVDAIDPLGLTT